MRGGVAWSSFLAFLVSVAVAALDQSNSLDLKHHGLASSVESRLSSDADTQYNPLTDAPDLYSNKLSSTGANEYGASQQSHKTHDFQGRPLGINLHDPSDNANEVSKDDEALRSAAFAIAKANSEGGDSSAFSNVQGQGDSSARALSGGSGYSSALAQADTFGGYSSSQADASTKALSGGPIPYGQSYPGAGYAVEEYGAAQQAQADASAQALGGSPYGTGYPVSGYPGTGSAGGGYGSAQALADASTQALNGGSIPYGSGYPSLGSPGGGYGSAGANADALAQTFKGESSPFGTGYPGSGLGGGYGSAQALADVSAQALNGGSSPYESDYPSSRFPGGEYDSTQAQAQADASAQVLIGGLSPYGSGYPGFAYGLTQPQSDALGSNSAKADASAQIISGGTSPFGSRHPVLSYPSSDYPSTRYNSAQAQADASAQTLSAGLSPSNLVHPSSGYPIPSYSSAQAQADASSGYGNGEAQANALAEALNRGSVPYNSGYPSAGAPGSAISSAQARAETSSGYGSGLTQAEALAQALSGGSSPYQLGLPSSNVPGSGYASAQAQADASARALREKFSPSSSVNPNYLPSGGYSLAQAEADASLGYGSSQAHADAIAKVLGGGSSPFSLEYNSAQAQANAAAQAAGSSRTHASSSASVFSRPQSRVIPQQEIMYPDQIPGGNNVITCSREGELHYLWSASLDCMVCTCIRQYFSLVPLCASCGGCRGFNPTPQPQPRPFPPQPPPPLPPRPQPLSQVSCAPLPTNQNFENPLNPCQICMCRPDLVYGVPDVKITCQQNPQCVIPPDAPVIPSIPDVPVPLPLCERFPQNVLFPHPSDYCRLCKCIARVSLFGIPEQQIECGPNPECENRPPFPPPTPPPFFPPDFPFPPEPVYPPQPFPPAPEPRPFSPEIDPLPPAPYPQPLPFVPIIRPEPVPWPPRPGPGPLPGPAPHESCLPYTPNIPFQHPWDECQLCKCSESHVVGLVSIEVDCYTKPSCCVEPPVSPLPLPAPLTPRVTPNPVAIQILDLICEFKTFAVQFLHPKDPCKKCSCEIFGRFVIPVCQRSNRIECSVQPAPIPNNQVVFIEPRCRNRLPYKQFAINCNLCVCQTAFNYVVAKCEPQPNCYPNDHRPTPYPLYGPEGGYSHASAEANAVAQNQPGYQYGVPRLPGTQYLIPGQVQPGGGSASADAHAQAITTNYPSGPGQPRNQYLIPGQTGNQYLIPGQPSSNYVIPGQLQPGDGTYSASAEAQAISGNYPSRPGQSGNQYLIQPGSLNLISGQPGSQYPIPGQLQPGGGYSSALAEAQAIFGNYPSRPGQPGNQYSIPSQPGGQNVIPVQLQPNGGYSSASAEARAQAGSGSYPSGPTYPYQGPGYVPAYGSPAANTQASANAVAEYNPNEQYNSGLNYPEPLSSSYANAEASASANEQQPYYIPGVYVSPTTSAIPSEFPLNYYPGGQYGAQATADAYASSDTGAAPALYPSPSNGNSYSYTPFDYPGSNQGGFSSAQAQAQALARTAEGGLSTDSNNNNANSQNNNLNNYLPPVSQGGNAQYEANYDPNYSQNSNAYPIFNEANAEADAVPASDVYPSMYPRPIYQKTPLYVPGQNGWDKGATPQTSPLLHGDTSAQSLAQAQAPVQAGSV